MEQKTSNNMGWIIDVISSNYIEPAPNQNPETSTTLMYCVGEGQIYITIERDKNLNVLFAYCINHTGKGKPYIIIDEHEFASNIFNACEQKKEAQEKEQRKLKEYEQKLEIQKRKQEKLEKQQRKLKNFQLRFGLDSKQIQN